MSLGSAPPPPPQPDTPRNPPTKERQCRPAVSAFSELRIRVPGPDVCAAGGARYLGQRFLLQLGPGSLSMHPRAAFATLHARLAGLAAVARAKPRRSVRRNRRTMHVTRAAPGTAIADGRERHLESGRAAGITTGRHVRKRLLDCAAREPEGNDVHLQRARSRGVRPRADEPDFIVVRGAREHNLAIDELQIPKRSLVVFTGVSGLGQIVAGVRHALRRGAAPLRRVAVVVRAPVPRADGEAQVRAAARAVADHRDRAEVGVVEPALDRRHGHRDLRLPARALRARRRAALPPVRRRGDGALGGRDRRRAADAAGQDAARR